MPEANIILGVSNISFGLNPAARVVLNSVFLHDCVEAGMNSAIVNASKILPLIRFNEHEIDTARDLIYDRRKFDGDVCTYDPLTEFTTLFEGQDGPVDKAGHFEPAGRGKTQAAHHRRRKDRARRFAQDGARKISAARHHQQHSARRNEGGRRPVWQRADAAAVRAAIGRGDEGGGEIPRAVHGKESRAANKGTLVLATVKGDVHDIGKNLVDIILTNNGYKVVNLGIKQPIDDILRAWEETKADAIGMSGLLVKSTLVMRDNLELMNERGINVPVILGGAALNRRYVDADLIPLYKGELFYARDAFDGLHAMDELTAEG